MSDVRDRRTPAEIAAAAQMRAAAEPVDPGPDESEAARVPSPRPYRPFAVVRATAHACAERGMGLRATARSLGLTVEGLRIAFRRNGEALPAAWRRGSSSDRSSS